MAGLERKNALLEAALLAVISASAGFAVGVRGSGGVEGWVGESGMRMDV